MDQGAVLSAAVASWVRIGWRVESYGPGHAVMVKGRRPNHVLHLLLTLLTLGLWLPVWAVLTGTMRVQRQVLMVGADGSVMTSRPVPQLVETLPRA